MAPKKRDLASQTLKFQPEKSTKAIGDVTFKTYRPAVSPVAVTQPKPETKPAGTPASHPYWTFSWQITSDTGLKLTDLVAVDALRPGSTQTVAELVDFTDLKVLFNDSPGGNLQDFPIGAAFTHKESKFEYGINGSSLASGTLDDLYQQGMMLTLVHDFGGTCKVTLRLCVVFRGPAHDFDPGGVPFSLNFYPQIGYTWESLGGSGRRVKQFRGSVRVLVNNQTSAFGSMHAMAENVANFWTDSNVSRNPGENRPSIMNEGCIADTWLAHRAIYFLDSRPFGWGLVFDYNRMFIQEEQEYECVYGPNDGTPYVITRSRLYQWPQSGVTKVADYKVTKVPRQGYYDNIHLHGRMHHKDPAPHGNEQIHAPFCGHSCVHLHWRWSNISATNAEGDRGWYYKGWSRGKAVEAFSEAGSPLIPPNQKLTVALCRPNDPPGSPLPTRVSATKILPPAGSRKTLHELRKLIWYCTDIVDSKDAKLNAGEQQVIFEHGIGWAYRYALGTESDAVDGLLNVFKGNPDPVTQANLMDFFETKIYPGFRYWTARGITTNQVPEGTHDDVMTGIRQTMESL